MKQPINEQCPEFPYFGAKYPDARCVRGNLHDLDDCDENGNLYESRSYNPCPFCNYESFIQNVIDDEGDIDTANEWIKLIKEKYS